VRRAVKNVAKRGKSKPKKVSRSKVVAALPPEKQHETDLRVLRGLWEKACDSAREEFQNALPAMVSLKQRLSDLEGEVQHLRSSLKCGTPGEPANRSTPSTTPAAPTAVVITSDDHLDIPEFLRRRSS